MTVLRILILAAPALLCSVVERSLFGVTISVKMIDKNYLGC
jgi:hypothetical protein